MNIEILMLFLREKETKKNNNNITYERNSNTTAKCVHTYKRCWAYVSFDLFSMDIKCHGFFFLNLFYYKIANIFHFNILQFPIKDDGFVRPAIFMN